MDQVLLVLTIAALLGSAVIGGVFFAFSSFVMRALDRLPAAQGLAAMQSINVTVLNWHFLGMFVGTAGVSAALVVLACLRWQRPEAAFVAIGGVLYFVGTFLVTGRCNVPLNQELSRVTAERAAAADTWQRYVRRWTLWNHVRTVAALFAALSFCLGLSKMAVVP